MAAAQSSWRVNDVVAYDLMRELSTEIQSRLLDLARNGDEAARAELTDVRRATLEVDGYDRPAVDAFAQELEARLTRFTAEDPR
jgi:hypothetical protein